MSEPRQPSRQMPGAPDRLTIGLFSLASFLVVLALLGSQIGSAASKKAPRRPVLLRRIYRTTVVERVIGSSSRGPSSSTSESQTLGPTSSAPAAVATRTS